MRGTATPLVYPNVVNGNFVIKGPKPWTDVTHPDFGVKGDGLTNDTVAAQAARTFAALGATIVVPSSTYIVDNFALTIAKQSWFFAKGAIFKVPSTTTFGEAVVLNEENIELTGGEFDGSRGVAVGNLGSGVITMRRSGQKVKGVYAHDADGYGIHGAVWTPTTPYDDTEVIGCTFKNTKNNAVFHDLSGATIPSRGHRIISCWNESSAAFEDNYGGGGFGIKGPPVVANQPQGIVISDCYTKQPIWPGNPAVEQAGFGFSNCNGAQITACYSEGGWAGYTFPETSNLSGVGCVAVGASDYGCELV